MRARDGRRHSDGILRHRAWCIVALLIAGCLAGAVGMGNEFTWEQVDRLKLGMSKEQVIAIMGSQPSGFKSTTEHGKTREELGWVDMDTFDYKSVSAIFVDGKLAEVTRTTGP